MGNPEFWEGEAFRLRESLGQVVTWIAAGNVEAAATVAEGALKCSVCFGSGHYIGGGDCPQCDGTGEGCRPKDL